MSAPAIQIESGIPLPPAKAGRPAISGVSVALRAAEVGQSFVAPPHALGVRHARLAAARAAAHVKGKKFATRVVVENGERVVRVWRTA